MNYIAFTVKEGLTVDSIRQTLMKNGVLELYSKKYPYTGGQEHYAFFFEDSDRIKLEILRSIYTQSQNVLGKE